MSMKIILHRGTDMTEGAQVKFASSLIVDGLCLTQD